MKKKITFEAFDGKLFNDGVECASYELSQKPEVVNFLNEKLKENDRLNYWCESGACCCMGCANGTFYKISLGKEHWQAWIKNFQKVSVEPKCNLDKSREMFIKIIEVDSYLNLSKFLADELLSMGVSSVQFLKSLKTNEVIFSDKNFNVIHHVENKLKMYPHKLHYVIVNNNDI